MHQYHQCYEARRADLGLTGQPGSLDEFQVSERSRPEHHGGLHMGTTLDVKLWPLHTYKVL